MPSVKTQQSKYTRCSRRGIVFIVIFVVILVIVVPVALVMRSQTEHETKILPVVKTNCGAVKGTHSVVYVFKGIPYAKPPVSDLRWKPPVALSKEGGSCWAGTFNATEFGNVCVQLNADYTGIIGSEDCLFLNVWTPTLDGEANLPVMVWVHGGSLESFSGNHPTYSPTEDVCIETNMVYVSMNYRLNAFGFMTLDVGSPLKLTGNYGFMDQQLALKWVQQNIANFGGNPKTVTMLGHSSGATSIMALLASPLSTGLFHRAVLMAGSAILNKTSQEAAKDNVIFLQKTGCGTAECLMNLSAIDIIQAIPWDVWLTTDSDILPTRGLFISALAVIDGSVLPMPPFEAWQAGIMSDVPVIVGNTAQEVDFSSPTDIESWTWDQYVEKVTGHLSTFPGLNISEVLKLYPVGTQTPEYQYTTMTTDIRVTCPLNVLSTSFNGQAYRYIVTAVPTEPAHLFGSSSKAKYSGHGLDIFAFFNTLKDYYIIGAQDEKFTENMRKEIIHFAKTGLPSTPSWLPYPNRTAIIDDDIEIADGYHDEQCSFWLKEGFLQYSWVN